MSDDEARRKAEKPVCDVATALAVAKKLYGLQADASTCKELESYDDRNFFVMGTLPRSSQKRKFLFKVHNGVESDNLQVIEAQNSIIMHMHKCGFNVPMPITANLACHPAPYLAFTTLPLKDTGVAKQHAVRLLHWVEGKCLSAIECDAKLLNRAGYYLGSMSKALDGFDHPGAHRIHQWDLNQTKGLSSFVHHIKDPARRKVVEGVIREWVEEVELLLVGSGKEGGLRTGMLQADFNDANIVLNDDCTAVGGVIDFGDTVHSLLVNDLAIGMAYSMVSSFGKKHQLEAAAAVYAGYVQNPDAKLLPLEKRVLTTLVACRLAISFTLGMYSYSQDPGNEYLLFHAEPAWTALEILRATPRADVESLFEKTAAAGPPSDPLFDVTKIAKVFERRNFAVVVFTGLVATALLKSI